MLENRYDISGFNCLDLFSGTGSISLELISRGCREVTSVDLDFGCIQFLKETTKLLDITNLHPIRSDVLRFCKSHHTKYDLIFADPPFDLDVRNLLHDIIFNRKLLSEKGVFIMEHSSREKYDQLAGFDFSRSYGNVTFSFFVNLEPSL